MRKVFIICLAIFIGNLAVFYCPSQCYGARLVSVEKIMSIVEFPTQSPQGNLEGVYFSLQGEGLHLKPYLNIFTKYYSDNGQDRVDTIKGGYIKLRDADDRADFLSFPINKWPFFRAYKIESDFGREFLLIIKGKQATSDELVTGVWLIGENGGKYITYADLNTVDKAGLIYQDISPKIENGELILIGSARDRDCHIWALQPGDIPYTYRGHSVTKERIGVGNLEVNRMSLFWDTDANWFGVRHAN